MLLTGPVERESHFQRLKAETAATKGEGLGSVFAFHGSGIGNWHSILRLGLKNYSNTKYMSAGAAYGVGVYFATQMSVSLGYCTRSGGSGWPLSRFGANCSFMALCELINRPDEYTHNSNIVVVPNEQYITTRYFLVNPTGNASTSDLEINFVSTVRITSGIGHSEDEKSRKRSKRWKDLFLGK